MNCGSRVSLRCAALAFSFHPRRGMGVLEMRTRAFSLRVIRLYAELPQTRVAVVLGDQLLRSSTAIGANYREGMFGRSVPEFISKLKISLMEAVETEYWLELLAESDTVPKESLADLRDEAGQIKAMLIASVKTAEANRAKTSEE